MRHQVDLAGIKQLSHEPGIDLLVGAYADEVKRIAVADAPVRTGHYVRSIKAVKVNGPSVLYHVRSDDFKAGFVEWGMGEMFARHNLFHAARKAGLKLRAVKMTH